MSIKILVIDDDTDVKEATQVMLMHEGYDVMLACDGKSGIEKYEQFQPDMTFLDIKMPGIDGYDTFAKIKEKYPDAKITFISGFSTDEIKLNEAYDKNLITILTKPFQYTELVKIIKKHC